METFVRRTCIAAPAEEVFRWHSRPGAFERLNPPWEPVEIVARHGGIADDAPMSCAIVWDPQQGIADVARLGGVDAVVHLAGENIVGRWTAEKRARIRESRVSGTKTLCETLARLSTPPNGAQQHSSKYRTRDSHSRFYA